MRSDSLLYFLTRRREEGRRKEGGGSGQGVTSAPGSNSNTATELPSKENSKSPTAKQETEPSAAPPVSTT